jgi:quercetin dioxygenase-like cupin family protein
MAKTTTPYWNPLQAAKADQWSVIEGTDGMIEQLFLAIDEETGDFTRLTRFKAGADTTDFGPQVHDFPEEIFIVSGQLYDQAFDRWLIAGDYASRPPGEVHGPFIAKADCVVLDCSFPSQASKLRCPE